MGGTYYYLIASLPMLDFDKTVNFSYQDFLSKCKDQLTESDYQILEKATLSYDEPTTLNPVLNRWARINRRFRNEIVRVRAKKIGRNSSDYIRGDRYVDPASLDVVHRVQKAENPLEAEKILDRFRWQKLSELTQRHIFNVEALIVYGLHLQILKRYQKINSSKGQEFFSQYTEQVLQKVNA